MPIVVSKWSPRRIIADHLATLVDARTRRLRKADYVSFYVVPAGIGATAWYFNFRFETMDPILSGTSIFTGLLFGVLVYVFQLRIRVTDSAVLASDSRLLRLIDELEANVAYTVLVGLVISGLLMALSATKEKDVPIDPIGTAVVIALMLHFILSVLLVLRRTRSVYARVTE